MMTDENYLQKAMQYQCREYAGADEGGQLTSA